jgi:hypothetical protein
VQRLLKIQKTSAAVLDPSKALTGSKFLIWEAEFVLMLNLGPVCQGIVFLWAVWRILLSNFAGDTNNLLIDGKMAR